MAYITRKSKKPEMLGDVGFTLDEKPEYTKKKEKKKELISEKETKDIVDTAREAFKLLKKEYPKGDLGADVAKRPNEKLEVNLNQKVKQGDLGSESGSVGKKEKVDASIFTKADEKDY